MDLSERFCGGDVAQMGFTPVLLTAPMWFRDERCGGGSLS
jgi:hypothetical protein